MLFRSAEVANAANAASVVVAVVKQPSAVANAVVVVIAIGNNLSKTT